MSGHGTVCVTGGAGFIGSHVVRRLLARGMRVRVLDDLSVGRRENVPPGVELVVGSILDADVVRECMRGADVVMHLAARVAIRSSQQYMRQDAETNVAGTASVVDAAASAGSVRTFVLASSMAVYADAPAAQPIDEDHRCEPISVYGVSKLAAEQMTRIVGRQAGMRTAALRLFNTYGQGQALSPYVGVVTIFADRLLRGEAPTIFGDGQQRRDFVHVDDVARAFVRAMDADLDGVSINVGTGRGVTVNEVLTALNVALGTHAVPRYADAVPGELRHSVADIARARRLLSYEPQHRFETAVGAVVQQRRRPALAREEAS